MQADVNDAVDGVLLGSLDPIQGSRESPSEIVGRLQQHVMGFLAVRFDERLAAPTAMAGEPPAFEAYGAFSQGIEEYLQASWDAGQPQFRRAFELDSTWAEALLFLVITHYNVREFAAADSLLHIMEGIGDRLTPYYRAYMQYLQALVDGDNEQALVAIQRAAEMAPGSRAWYNYGMQAHRTNRPRLAIVALSSLDPERGPMRGSTDYFYQLIAAYLSLGEYENALSAARQEKAIIGHFPRILAREAYALAGLGRIDEVNALVGEILALPEQGLEHGNRIRGIAAELRFHGLFDAAQATANRAIEWYESRFLETKSDTSWSLNYARALHVAGRWDDAYRVAKRLSDEIPENENCRGLVGLLAAHRGDREEALEISGWLEELDRPYLLGEATMWRSAIAAALGDAESAVALWRLALAEGFQMLPLWDPRWDGRMVAFEPLRDYPPFQELMRPKG
jgi:tetratricopeptide (TPR) repeat protein